MEVCRSVIAINVIIFSDEHPLFYPSNKLSSSLIFCNIGKNMYLKRF